MDVLLLLFSCIASQLLGCFSIYIPLGRWAPMLLLSSLEVSLPFYLVYEGWTYYSFIDLNVVASKFQQLFQSFEVPVVHNVFISKSLFWGFELHDPWSLFTKYL